MPASPLFRLSAWLIYQRRLAGCDAQILPAELKKKIASIRLTVAYAAAPKMLRLCGRAWDNGTRRPVFEMRTWVERCRRLAIVSDSLLLPPPSPEQQLVLKAVKQGRNTVIVAVAGSGKTTTILHVAKSFPNKKILGSTLTRNN